MRRLVTAGGHRAWTIAAGAALLWAAADLALAVAGLTAADAPRPLPRRVIAAWIACGAAIPAAAAALAAASRRAARATAARGGAAVPAERPVVHVAGAAQALLAAALGALVATSAFDFALAPRLLAGLIPPHADAILEAGCDAALVAIFAALAWWAARRRARGLPPGRLVRGLAVVALAAAACELWLLAWGRIAPSPVLAGGATAERFLAAYRLPPGARLHGFPANRGGYYDAEFFAAGPGDLVVALLGDSFAVGVVPYAQGFAAVTEGELETALGGERARVAVHNFGVAGAGLRDYAYLLQREVEPLRPSLVVLAIFVGNDVLEFDGLETVPATHASLRHWLLWQVPRRLAAIAGAAAPRHDLDASAPGPAAAAGDPGAEPADAGAGDAALPPTHSAEDFLAIETRRAAILDAASPAVAARYDRFLAALARFHGWLGDRLVVLLLPDEMQVSDALWEEVRAARGAPATWERDLPQRRILAFCASAGIACVDALPALRAAEAIRPTYWPRDTHLNAHGNRVVAGELARALVDRVSGGDRRR